MKNIINYSVAELRIYNKRYCLNGKPGLDFFSIAHDYYYVLATHHFCQLEDRTPQTSLKTWMINGFRFVLLDHIKAYNKETCHSKNTTQIDFSGQGTDVSDDNFSAEFDAELRDLCQIVELSDHSSATIIQKMLIEGYSGREVAKMLGITPSAVSQRYHKVIEDIIVPHFRQSSTFLPSIRRYSCMCSHLPQSEASVIVDAHWELAKEKSELAMEEREMAKEDSILAMEKREMDKEKSEKRSRPRKRWRAFKSLWSGYFKTSAKVESNAATASPYDQRVTPEDKTQLAYGEIFVLDSGLEPILYSGAEQNAKPCFGIQFEFGSGSQGKSFAIPTMFGGIEDMRPYVAKFISYAKQHGEQKFLVTTIGCGLAGYMPNEIAPLFEEARNVSNIYLPKSFWDVLDRLSPADDRG